MKQLLKEAFRDAMTLSALVIVPMLFLGPGWTPKEDKALRANFSDLHPEKSGNDLPAHPEHPFDILMESDFDVDRSSKNR
jgi:hypothetical protein